ncbi:MAG: glycoside hydrolase family 32 protein, partial [Clostridia bacterium]|nr:glycoside hydrolase family 32 protein [Clostridia bacterium]
MNDTLIKKPAFHITGEKGWINDPNGLVFFKGKYHAFFQYYPHDTKWGPMHWGHVVSEDLTN